MTKQTKTIVITYLAFGIYFLLDEIYFKDLRNTLNQVINNGGVSHIIAYLISGIPIYLGAVLIHNRKEFANGFGLSGSILKGIYVPLLFTLPMFIGFAIIFKFNSEINLEEFLIKVVAAAFFEELFFRSFLFGQVFRFTKIGFIPSVLFGALLFGFIHLYQSQEFYESIGIFAITFLGGILFAWVYAEWNYNIWVPVFLHSFMNLSAMMFSATENALGGIYFNVFRTITVLLVILGTIFYKKNKNSKLEVHRQNLWIKNSLNKSIKL